VFTWLVEILFAARAIASWFVSAGLPEFRCRCNGGCDCLDRLARTTNRSFTAADSVHEDNKLNSLETDTNSRLNHMRLCYEVHVQCDGNGPQPAQRRIVREALADAEALLARLPPH
jgi:hypothetical protein